MPIIKKTSHTAEKYSTANSPRLPNLLGLEARIEDVETANAYLKYDKVIGTTAEILTGEATHTIDNFHPAVSNGDKIFILNGTHVPTGDIEITETGVIIRMQSKGASITTDTYTFESTGADCDIELNVSDSANVTISGAGTTSRVNNSLTVNATVKTNLIEKESGSELNIQDVGSLKFNSLPGSSIIQVFSKEVFKRQNLMAVTQTVITTPEFVLCAIDDVIYTKTASVSINLDLAASWASDKASYATPGNRNGMDIYLYACKPTSGTEFDYILTDNSTNPAGYTVDTSRKIAGFHTLCAAVGTISGHILSDYAAGDILPLSVWDLFHRSISENTGLVWSEKAGKWTGIYPCSNTDYYPRFTSTAKVSTNWMNFVDGLAGINQQLLDDSIFQIIAAGSNEESSYGASAPISNSGGFTESSSITYNPDRYTTPRRMISDIGCESCCGVWYQWLRDQSYQYASTATFGWVDQTGGKGELYLQGATADVKLLAGGNWNGGAPAGSRSRYAHASRWRTDTSFGARGCAEPRITVLD